MAQSSGFDPQDAANLAYVGYDQVFVLTRSPAGQPFVAHDTWYLRIAAYDQFGSDGLQWSAEHQVTIAASDANLTPEQVLAQLNASFVQGNVVVDGSGSITVYNGSPSTPNRDFALLTAGIISFKRYRDGQYREYKSLKRVEAGNAPSGQTVTLPGYWDQQPKVTVSPQSLKSYSAAYPNQDQTWACRADNLREDPAASGIWKFDAVAELQLASNAGTTSINQASGDIASAWASSGYLLPPNVRDITVNVKANSKRGTGVHTAEWVYRRVTATVYTYSAAGGWVQSGQTVLLPGTNLDGSVTGAIGCFNLAVGTNQFYVHFDATDNGGTFSTGSDVYNYGSDTLVGNNGSAQVRAYIVSGQYYGFDQNNVRDPNNYGGFAQGTYHMPPYTPPVGWEVYSVGYAYLWSGATALSSNISPPSGAFYADGQTRNGVWKQPWDGGSVTWISGSWTRAGTYDPEAVKVRGNNGNSGWGPFVKDVVATIYRRQLILNSATPVNAFTLSSYDWQVASASALATGSINYLAVGA